MEYRIIESSRKTIAIQVNDKEEIIVRVPYRYPKKKIEKFVYQQNDWIENAIKKQRQNNNNKLNLTENDIKMLKALANSIIPQKVSHYSKIMGVKPTRVKITSAKKRFGSCSSSDSLCFSYILMLYPEEAINYVVVHELAHLVHHNHSKDFYNLISEYISDYKKCEKLLKGKQTFPFDCNV